MRTKKTVIVLLSGKAGSGKTTVSELMRKRLEDTYPELRVEKYSLANPIKFVAQAFFGWDKEKDDAGRKLLQNLGAVGREYKKEIWVTHLLTQLDRNFNSSKYISPANFVLVDDWRFPDELSYLQKNPLLDIVAVRVFGRGGLEGDVSLDVSENSLPEVDAEFIPVVIEGDHWYDFQINNNDDLELLESKIDMMLSVLEKQYIVK